LRRIATDFTLTSFTLRTKRHAKRAITKADRFARGIAPERDHPGTGPVPVAREAVKAEVGWMVLNREVDYVAELRATVHAPVFAVTTDHAETGRIQGRQMNALLRRGGTVVYFQGPSGPPVVQARGNGMLEAKDPMIKVRRLNGHSAASKR
jgi:hypothetical protein